MTAALAPADAIAAAQRELYEQLRDLVASGPTDDLLDRVRKLTQSVGRKIARARRAVAQKPEPKPEPAPKVSAARVPTTPPRPQSKPPEPGPMKRNASPAPNDAQRRPTGRKAAVQETGGQAAARDTAPAAVKSFVGQHRRVLWLVVAAAVLTLIVLSLTACSSAEAGEPVPATTSAEPDPLAEMRAEKADAVAACEEFVKGYLKAPATATFADVEASAIGDGHTWEVLGGVDSENSYGALVRSTFSCTTERSSSTDEWTPVDVWVY
jgi:hypothetical protein